MSTVDVHYDGESWLVRCGPLDADLMKGIPGARFLRTHWSLPGTWAAAVAIGGTFGERAALTEDARYHAASLRSDVKGAAAIKAGTAKGNLEVKAETSGDPLWEALYPFQKQGVAFLAFAEGVALCDEMGTGKTVQALSALRVLGKTEAAPALVVCPNSMKWTWAQEAEKWLPGWSVAVVDGSAKKRAEALRASADLTIINWESLRLHTRVAGYGSIKLTDEERRPKELNTGRFAQLRTVIADEAHRAKSAKAKQTRALWGVAAGAAPRYRWALTGTPIANTPEDLWSIMRFVDPESWPSKVKYLDRYCRLIQSPWGSVQVAGLREDTKAELFSFLDPHMIRRTKAEVLPDLPDKTYQVRYVPMPPAQKKVYDQIAKHMMAKLGNEILVAADPLSKLTRLVQAASATLAFAEGEGQGNSVALTAPSNKVTALMDIINDELPADESLVVFASSRRLIDLCAVELETSGFKLGLITGAQSSEDRAETIRAFQAGEIRVVLVTLGAGSEGITLTRASRAVFLQRSWSMVQNKQAEDRIHRVGQTANNVEYIDIVTPNTIEDAVRLVLVGKDKNLQEVVRDEQWLRSALTGA